MPTRWKNSQGDISDTRPIRVRKPDGLTLTNEEVTDEVLSSLGWFEESYELYIPPVATTSTQTENIL